MTTRTRSLAARTAFVLAIPFALAAPVRLADAGDPGAVFSASGECLACHNGLSTLSGQDVSIGAAWRGSMMAQSARDPYWQAAVRREAMDHPAATEAIEDECSVCHLPMARTLARLAGRKGRVFAHLPIGSGDSEVDRLAADGVSCSACHQILGDGLGERSSFTGGYQIAGVAAPRPRPLYGGRTVDAGLASIMRSSTGFVPEESSHLRESETCATCHTLITHALDPQGQVVGELPEQVPYLEWQHSAFARARSCASCHLPPAADPAPIASVLAAPREGLARHGFLGGNAFMLRLLNRHRHSLGVAAFPHELEATAAATERQLRDDTASLRIERLDAFADHLRIGVAVEIHTGHKLPTGYPSRRAWLHLLVRGANGEVIFESGGIDAAGRIAGNANDSDASSFEPHHREIRSPDDVQVYEAIMADHRGAVTTGLLRGTRYLKDNRLLPQGFDKATAPPEIAVRGHAAEDGDFRGGGDVVLYQVGTDGASGPYSVEVELRYQTIAHRWAENLRAYDAPETRQFVSAHAAAGGSGAITLARATAVAR